MKLIYMKIENFLSTHFKYYRSFRVCLLKGDGGGLASFLVGYLINEKMERIKKKLIRIERKSMGDDNQEDCEAEWKLKI